VDPILEGIAEESAGEYVSRIKGRDSTFEKLLRGENARLEELEDLFGATIILPFLPLDDSREKIGEALGRRFVILDTRTARTRKPSEFIYDDLHYVLKLKDIPLLTDKSLSSWAFELQVKSYLQYGWTKATHKAIYKAKEEQWALSRVAAQTKAMVEVADLALSGSSAATPEGPLDGCYPPIEKRRAIVTTLEVWWKGDLPDDRRRLGIFVGDMLRLANWSLERLQGALDSERGCEISGLRSITVQQAVLILILELNFSQIIKQAQLKKRFLFVSTEMESLSAVCRNVPEDLRVAIS
jgi:ppGpp synthetase/RelA/SpoT-type nucleotidyltranferase